MFSAKELQAREQKLRLEQSQRIDRERQKIEKERILQDRQKQREREREEERARKKLEQELAEQKARELEDMLTEHNNGVYFRAQLEAIPSNQAAVAARGIKRAEDKVLLPHSVGRLLMDQGASRNGAMLFEISTPGRCITHAGLLEFTSPEGVVAMPRKVAECLWGRGRDAGGPVTVTYKRLEKGTFVRFQPLTRGFHEAAGEHIREVLERALMQCTVLTEGDIIRVDCSQSPLEPPPPEKAPAGLTASTIRDDEAAGSISSMDLDSDAGTSTDRPEAAVPPSSPPLVFELLVQELQPSSAVSLIDTDMEAQVVPSLETEQALKQMEEQRRYLEEQRQAREQQALEVLRQAQEETLRQRSAEETRRNEEIAERERERAALEASLPPEPPASCSAAENQEVGPSSTGMSGSAASSSAPPPEPLSPPPITSVVFRMPDGSRAVRRFLLTDKTGLLFHFCDAKGAGGLKRGSYRLIMQYPRRVLEPVGELDLASAGLIAGQMETVMLEPLLQPTSTSQTGSAVGNKGSSTVAHPS